MIGVWELIGYALGFFLLGGLVLGPLMLLGAYRQRKERQFISETPTSTIQSIAIGPVELSGTVEPIADEPGLVSPVSGEECVFVDVSTKVDGETKVGLSGRACREFYLSDETGKVRVTLEEPEKLWAYLESNTETLSIHSTETPPAALEQFIEETDILSEHEGGFLGTKRDYTFQMLPVGTSVYLAGFARPTCDENAEAEIGIGERGIYFLSDKSQSELLNERKHLVIGMVLAGLWTLLSYSSLVLL